MLIMDWVTRWCVFHDSLTPDSRIMCVSLFLHLTIHLLFYCQPFLAAHAALHVQLPNTQNNVHRISEQENTRTVSFPPVFAEPSYCYTWDQLMWAQSAALDPSLTPCLRELGTGYHLPCKRSCRGGQRKQRRISVVCGTAAHAAEPRISAERTSIATLLHWPEHYFRSHWPPLPPQPYSRYVSLTPNPSEPKSSMLLWTTSFVMRTLMSYFWQRHGLDRMEMKQS